MNKKIIIICVGLFCLFVTSAALFVNYYAEYYDLKRIIEANIIETTEKNDLYEQIIRQYEFMDFKIFAFEKRYSEFARIVNRAFEEAKKNNLSPYTVLSVIQVESNFDPKARSNVADGLMQINLDAWKSYFQIDQKKIYEIDYNISLGCKILRHYLEVARGDLSRALYLYNNGYGFHNKTYVPKVVNNMYSRANK